MKSLRRVRERRGRCYELAFHVMQDEPGAERFTLIHGLILGGVSHAWIEVGDGRFYDPVTDEYLPADEYITAKRAVIERRYTHAEATRMLMEAKHYGPWHVSAQVEAFQRTPEFVAWCEACALPPRRK